jgi:N-acetylglutamate synthase-like GNAT family acetyltransferase
MTNNRRIQTLGVRCLLQRASELGGGHTDLRCLRQAEIRPRVRVATRHDKQMPKLRLRFKQRRNMKPNDQFGLPKKPAWQLDLARHLPAHVAPAHAPTLYRPPARHDTARSHVLPSGRGVGDIVRPVFRDARREDLPGVLRLLEQLNPEDRALEPSTAETVFEAISRNPGLRLFVLEEDGAIVATSYLNVIPNLTRAASPYAVIENVIVEQAHRGKGLGKRLMAGALNAAWQAGCYKAMLQTGSSQPATHAFYKACGFSPSEKTAYVAHPVSSGVTRKQVLPAKR